MFNLSTETKRREAFKRMGNTFQAAGTRHYILSEGNNYGTRAVDVKTGSGLEYTVVKDRGMDISLASYKGINLVYLTNNGEVNPAFYESQGSEWLRTFFGGLLTTCGTTYLGPPCIDDGEELGLHGRHSSIPATRVCDLSDFDTGEIRITGRVEESVLYGNMHVVLRDIHSKIGKSVITIEDRVRNIKSKDSPFTILYHINFGYPLLDEHSEVYVTSAEYHAYDDYSQGFIDDIYSFEKPGNNNYEKNYWHSFDENKGAAYAIIANRELMDGLAVYIKFDPRVLPYLNHWKVEDELDYVLALEPSNTFCYSRKELREKGLLPILKGHEERKIEVEIGVIDGNKEIDEFLKSIGGI
ncbi:MAG: aldose 1-epimerase family protein [Clostridiales bacterium]|nr:aldose 1-epimerase family protein [Clostridiales bacterium]